VADTDPHGAIVRLLNELETLRRSLRLYPPSHPALQPARARIRSRVSALGEGGEVAVLSFGPDQLFWNGEKVSLPPSAPAVKLVGLLFDLGLAALRLHFPHASDGLPDLAGRIAWLHEPPGERDRAYLLAEADARGNGGVAGREGSMLDPDWAAALREVIQHPSGAQPPG